MTEPILPIVHLNGTSRDELVNLRLNAVNALCRAISALNDMAPNARDYYPEPGRMEQALVQHDARARTLTDLYREINTELMRLVNG